MSQLILTKTNRLITVLIVDTVKAWQETIYSVDIDKNGGDNFILGVSILRV